MELTPFQHESKTIRTPLVEQTDIAPEEINLKAQSLFGKLVQEINQKMNEGLDYDKILDYIFNSLKILIPYNRMGIATVDDSTQTIRLDWVKSDIPMQHLLQNYSAPLKSSSLQKVLLEGKPRIINDLEVYAKEHPESESTRLILRDGIRSNLTCPLKSNNKAVGIVFFSCSKPNAYNHDHVDIFLSIANELAVIIEQGRLKHFFSEYQSKAQAFRTTLHDLKAPLSIIQGYLDLCVDEGWYDSLNPEAKNIFETLKRNTRHMFQLIGDLSELNVLESGTTKLAIEPVDPVIFSKEMGEYGKILAKSKSIFFSTQIGKLPTLAYFDPDKIKRVLENLFTNAVKFSKRHSTIEFQVEEQGPHLLFSVTDQGQGIPESEQNKLFTEYGRTSTKPTEGESSTGLGLAISRKLVELHGGKISFVSKQGKGSKFFFWIPIY